MLKKIFIYSLLFTFHLESVEGRIFTTTQTFGNEIFPEGLVVKEYSENRGKVKWETETEYKIIDKWLQKMPKEEKFKLLEEMDWELWYKFFEQKVKVVSKGKIIVDERYYYENGNLWIVNKSNLITNEEIEKNCYDEEGNEIPILEGYGEYLTKCRPVRSNGYYFKP